MTKPGIYPPSGAINPYISVPSKTQKPDPMALISISVNDCLASYALRPPGLQLPWRELKKLSEIDTGSITTFIAGTSHGKTAVALHLLLTYLRQGQRVLLFSGEMDKSVIVMRLLSIMANCSLASACREYSNLLASQPVTASIMHSLRELESLQDNIFIAPPNSRDADIINYAKLALPDIIMIDYIQQLRPIKANGRTRDEEIESVMDTLNQHAITYQVPIILFAQINREARNTEKPSLTSIRHSATVEQYSANVYGIWNASMARVQGGSPSIPADGWYWTDDSKTTDQASAYAEGHNYALLEISILKSRYHGNVCKSIPLLFCGITGEIIDFPITTTTTATI